MGCCDVLDGDDRSERRECDGDRGLAITTPERTRALPEIAGPELAPPKVKAKEVFMEYHVMWEIDIEGDDPVDAALQALACVQRRGTTAVVFDVTAEDGETIRVDLMNEERYLKP